jgi:hypothetical protein
MKNIWVQFIIMGPIELLKRLKAMGTAFINNIDPRDGKRPKDSSFF